MDGSVPVNLVSDLLKKAGRFREEKGKDTDENAQIELLAEYLWKRIGEVRGNSMMVPERKKSNRET